MKDLIFKLLSCINEKHFAQCNTLSFAKASLRQEYCQYLSYPHTGETPTSLSSPFQEVEFVINDQNIDELNNEDKSRMICMLLDTLPSVQDMKGFWFSKGGSDSSLRTWHERVSPAALGILRWIIASNRSCIIQADNALGQVFEIDGKHAPLEHYQFCSAQPNNLFLPTPRCRN